MPLEAQVTNALLNQRTQFAIACQHQPRVGLIGYQPLHGVQEQKVSLFSGKSTDAQEHPGRTFDRRKRLKKIFVYRATYDVNLVPLSGCHPPTKLCVAKIAYRDNKSSILGFLSQGKPERRIKFDWAVNRHAVSGPTKAANEPGYGCGVSAEVNMNVLYVVNS